MRVWRQSASQSPRNGLSEAACKGRSRSCSPTLLRRTQLADAFCDCEGHVKSMGFMLGVGQPQFFVAPDHGAGIRARLPRGARSCASRSHEPFGEVLGAHEQVVRRNRSRRGMAERKRLEALPIWKAATVGALTHHQASVLADKGQVSRRSSFTKRLSFVARARPAGPRRAPVCGFRRSPFES